MLAAPLLKKHRARSAWPMILAMLSCVAVVLGPAVLYLLPLFAICGVLFFVLQAMYREARVKARALPDMPSRRTSRRPCCCKPLNSTNRTSVPRPS